MDKNSKHINTDSIQLQLLKQCLNKFKYYGWIKYD